MATIVGKALRGFGKALKYHKAKRAASKKVHFDFQKGTELSTRLIENNKMGIIDPAVIAPP